MNGLFQKLEAFSAAMEWLNYHHLLYFWTVAKEGSLRAASEKLRVSQPSISAQLHALEHSLGQPLFRASGRGKVLTDAGQMVFGYAEEIFTLGGELMNAVKNRPTARALRLNVGLADSFPKLVAHDILKPLFAAGEPMHVVCREGKIADLLAQLALHRLDVVLADEPASSSHNLRSFSHLLAKSTLTLCAAPAIAKRLRSNFPRSLHGAPALMPSENTPMRRSLENWFRQQKIEPRVIGEFDDAALMKVVASEGGGFIAVPTAVADDASARYGFEHLGTAGRAQVEFYAITAERRLAHPGVVIIAEESPKNLRARREPERLARKERPAK